MKGLAEGFDSYMLDVTTIVKASWDNIGRIPFLGAGLSPGCYQLEHMMNQRQGSKKIKNTSNGPNMQKLLHMQALSINLNRRDPL